MDSLENGSAEQEVTAAAVNRLCQQVQELEARHKAMDAGAASVAQLAAQQEQLSKAMAMGPQVGVGRWVGWLVGGWVGESQWGSASSWGPRQERC